MENYIYKYLLRLLIVDNYEILEIIKEIRETKSYKKKYKKKSELKLLLKKRNLFKNEINNLIQ